MRDLSKHFILCIRTNVAHTLWKPINSFLVVADAMNKQISLVEVLVTATGRHGRHLWDVDIHFFLW